MKQLFMMLALVLGAISVNAQSNDLYQDSSDQWLECE